MRYDEQPGAVQWCDGCGAVVRWVRAVVRWVRCSSAMGAVQWCDGCGAVGAMGAVHWMD